MTDIYTGESTTRSGELGLAVCCGAFGLESSRWVLETEAHMRRTGLWSGDGTSQTADFVISLACRRFGGGGCHAAMLLRL